MRKFTRFLPSLVRPSVSSPVRLHVCRYALMFLFLVMPHPLEQIYFLVSKNISKYLFYFVINYHIYVCPIFTLIHHCVLAACACYVCKRLGGLGYGRQSDHWNGNVILTKFSSLATLEVVKTTTSNATSDKKFIWIIFRWLGARLQ